MFTGAVRIDDSMDVFTGHTILHDTVMLNREEIFEFLLAQGANLNMRDQNGYTPLLKAASLGRLQFCKRLIESGVDPRHTDPFGNTPLDKAKLFNQNEVIRYLELAVNEANEGKREFIDWRHPDRKDMDGRFRTFLHY